MVGVKVDSKPVASAVGSDPGATVRSSELKKPAASAVGSELKASLGGLRTDLSSKIVSTKRTRSIPEAKPEIDPTEKQRLREIQIHEAELIHKEELTAKPNASTRRETQARELLQGITELLAFRDATDKWEIGRAHV